MPLQCRVICPPAARRGAEGTEATPRAIQISLVLPALLEEVSFSKPPGSLPVTGGKFAKANERGFDFLNPPGAR